MRSHRGFVGAVHWHCQEEPVGADSISKQIINPAIATGRCGLPSLKEAFGDLEEPIATDDEKLSGDLSCDLSPLSRFLLTCTFDGVVGSRRSECDKTEKNGSCGVSEGTDAVDHFFRSKLDIVHLNLAQ